jgi:magnesium-transporting ATPase (P-type)
MKCMPLSHDTAVQSSDVQIRCFQENLDLVVLATLRFTPERQCMTVAVTDPRSADDVLVLCKGSPEKIETCLSERNATRPSIREGLQLAQTFADKGGRVFCFAFKVPLCESFASTTPTISCHYELLDPIDEFCLDCVEDAT